jgi:hypothetical protein
MPHPQGGSIPPDQGFINNRRQSGVALAAAGVSLLTRANQRFKVYHMLIKLVTSITVGNRLILVQLNDGTNVIAEWVNSGAFGTGRTVAASTTERYEITTLHQSDAAVTVFKQIQHPFPMGPSWVVKIVDTAAIDAAGDLVSIEDVVEEWIDN